MPLHKKGQTVRSDARNMVRRIIKKCEEERDADRRLHPMRQPTIRVMDYTGLSKKTIQKIRKESSQIPEDTLLSSPGKKRPRGILKKFYCSNEDKAIIRNVIYEFYVEKKIVPSAPKLLAAIREKIDFPWKLDSLHKLLKSMGFKWRKSNSIRKVLIERPNIVIWREKIFKSFTTL